MILPGWTVLVPVKALDRAKSRLRASTGRDTSALALAFALDTVEAAGRAGGVGGVHVITADPLVAAEAVGMGAAVLPDLGGGVLNLAVGRAAELLAGPDAGVGLGLAVLPADLPGLDPADLELALSAATAHPRAFLADAGGVGTTLLTARAGHRLEPRYGPGSAAAHQAGGAHPLGVPAPTVRADVDRSADLRALRHRPCGRRTREWLDGHPDRPSTGAALVYGA
ncbi:2-phospho-L-lactate guanylyltransferase [Geodermatophilus ruber]|uniref:Phosphoenolpyruvate guanylyltransferase n=1 Tax=Geodermatophilus ruber TaxID=504800 RepID=A0A1I4HCA5_9ACTN|nr:2-phospho-L-lactate guanylyltransferase [Geodermatophilus ruber]SFL39929.1 2-phospho-L-lactate guanylyltransferase [Geodermatophilus ruber]